MIYSFNTKNLAFNEEVNLKLLLVIFTDIILDLLYTNIFYFVFFRWGYFYLILSDCI
jgi:hypothetical protein